MTRAFGSAAGGNPTAEAIAPEPVRLAISLVSHTNAGKTTLARTLLGRDVGIVRDAAHVTDTIDGFELLATGQGDRLTLWDTPGFGDSARLAARLARAGNPIGWVLTEVWDRWRDRPFWSSQQAIRHVRDHTDIVLYLVNAAEDPADAAYVHAEMQILDWVGKPVIVLLNQLGAPREPAIEAAECARWAQHLRNCRPVREVLALDAFARCWVQESTLLAAIARALPPAHSTGFARLWASWHTRQQALLDASMQILASRLARAALDREPLARPGFGQRIRQAGALLGIGEPGQSAQHAAMQALGERLEADIRATTTALIALHGLDGQANREVIERLAHHFRVSQRLGEGKAAVLGGLVTGSLAGLGADLASGGLSLGAGLIAGGLLGALGAAGLARGYNRVRGINEDALTWDDSILTALLEGALTGYLVVAHFGRGRGRWDSPEAPAHWAPTLSAALGAHQPALAAIWQMRSPMAGKAPARTAAHAALCAALAPLLGRLIVEVLEQLYPLTEPSAQR